MSSASSCPCNSSGQTRSKTSSLGLMRSVAGVTVAAQAETDPHPLGALVEDVERGVTARAEAGEIALLLQRREIGVDGSHLSEP